MRFHLAVLITLLTDFCPLAFDHCFERPVHMIIERLIALATACRKMSFLDQKSGDFGWCHLVFSHCDHCIDDCLLHLNPVPCRALPAVLYCLTEPLQSSASRL